MLKLSGSGDYTSSAPVAKNSLFVGSRNFGSTPSGINVNGTGDGTVRLTHREFITNILVPDSPGDFTTSEFVVNPGNFDTCPYLANIARLFEQYRWNGLVFEFITTTSPYNSTSAMGAVMMAAEYNVNQAVYSSQREMLDSDYAISVRPDKSCLYGVECARQAAPLYYVNNDRNIDTPRNLTDLCKLVFGTQLSTGYVPGAVLGELWVSYDITLVTPIFMSPSSGSAILATRSISEEPLSDYSGSLQTLCRPFVNPDEIRSIGSGRLPLSSTVRANTPLFSITTESETVYTLLGPTAVPYDVLTINPDLVGVGEGLRVTVQLASRLKEVNDPVMSNLFKNDPSNPTVYTAQLVFPKMLSVGCTSCVLQTAPYAVGGPPVTYDSLVEAPTEAYFSVVSGSDITVGLTGSYTHTSSSTFVYKVTQNSAGHRPSMKLAIPPHSLFATGDHPWSAFPYLNGGVRVFVDFLSASDLSLLASTVDSS